MCDPPLNSSHEVWPSPFGAHFHCWPSPLRPQPSPPKKKRTFPYFQTDASFHGFGAVCPDDWFAGSWSDCLAPDFRSSRFHNQHYSNAGHTIDPSLRSNINYLELFPILIAVRRWGPRWLNKRVCVETDNTQTMAFINNGTCKNPIAMSWLREIFWISVRYNFHLRSRHLPGKLMRRSIRKFNIPPGQPPGHLNFWRLACSNSLP